ncbi:MAG: PorT family protein, partial [Bacteroidales bacterium]|nr:PorT family protein [Bacteroidales bacterium]
MKRISFALVMLSVVTTLSAQEVGKQPVVNWGLKLQANTSNFIFKDVPTMPSLSSKMNVGAEVGGFIDFNITQRFYIQFGLMGTFEQCTLNFGDRTAPMQSTSLEIPVFALWRFGDAHLGWFSIGGGPYTEFIIWGELEGSNPFHHVITDAATG